MFGLDSGTGIQSELGGAGAPSGLTEADIQALSGLTPNQGTGVASEATQSPFGSPVPVSPNSLGPLSPQGQSQNTPSATPLSSSVSTGGKVGESVEVSSKQWSEPVYKNILATTEKTDSKGKAQNRAEAAGYEQVTGQDYTDALGLKGQAVQDQTALNARIADSKTELEATKARLMSEHAGEIEKMQAVVQAKTEQASANYAGQLATIAATRIDHNQLYHDKGAAGKIAMLASSFVGGILDAKGVKNNIQGTLMKTIDDNVSDQIANLNNQKDVAQGFLQLYNMAVADGSNQIAAKTKLQGMYLTAFEQQATAELSKYGSELAKSTGKAALADLAMEKANIFKKVRDDANDRLVKAETLRLTERGQNMSAATAAAQLKFQREEANHRREDAKAAARAGALDNIKKLVINNTDGSISRIAYDEDSAKLARKTHAGASQLDSDVAELRAMVKAAGGLGMKGRMGTLFNDVDDKRAQALYNRIISNELRVQSGAAVNEAEVERKVKEIGDGSWTAIKAGGVGAFEQTLQDHERLNLQAVEKYDQQYSMSIPEDQRQALEAQGLSGRSVGDPSVFGKNRREELEQLNKGAPGADENGKTPDDRLAEKAASPSHDIHTGVAPASIPDSWKKYGKDSGWTTELADPELRKGLMKLTPEQRQTAIEMAGGEGPDTAEPVYVPHMDALALILSDDKATSERKQWAANQLLNIAATAKDSTQADYAQYLAKSVGVEYDDRQLQQIRATGAVPKGSDVSGRLQQDLDLLRMSE